MTDLDKRIKALCEAKGITFKPWQFPERPWTIRDNERNRESPGTCAAIWFDQCLALRAALKKELEQQ